MRENADQNNSEYEHFSRSANWPTVFDQLTGIFENESFQ